MGSILKNYPEIVYSFLLLLIIVLISDFYFCFISQKIAIKKNISFILSLLYCVFLIFIFGALELKFKYFTSENQVEINIYLEDVRSNNELQQEIDLILKSRNPNTLNALLQVIFIITGSLMFASIKTILYLIRKNIMVPSILFVFTIYIFCSIKILIPLFHLDGYYTNYPRQLMENVIDIGFSMIFYGFDFCLLILTIYVLAFIVKYKTNSYKKINEIVSN